jgi:hypothetical protein
MGGRVIEGDNGGRVRPGERVNSGGSGTGQVVGGWFCFRQVAQAGESGESPAAHCHWFAFVNAPREHIMTRLP